MQTNPYKSFIIFTVIGLTVLITLLSTLLLSSGPRVRFVDFGQSGKNTTQSENTILSIKFDRPLQDQDYTSQISFSPELNFTAKTGTQSIDLTLQENWLHNTSYTLTVSENVYDQSGKKMANGYETTFMTATPTFAYIERNYGYQINESTQELEPADDYIKLAELDKEAEIIFSHPEITMFAANSDYIVVGARSENTDELYTYNLKTGDTRQETLILNGRVSNLTTSSSGKIALFTVIPDYERTSEEYYSKYANRVESLNLETGLITPLTTEDDEYIKAYDIEFASSGQVALIEDESLSTYAVSPFNDFDPVLVGKYTSLFDVNSTASQILFNDNNSVIIYSTDTSTAENIVEVNNIGYLQAVKFQGNSIYASYIDFLANETYAEVRAIDQSTSGENNVAWTNINEPTANLRDFSLSFDEELIAVQLNPQDCTYDSMLANSQCQDTQTKIYDTKSHKLVEEFKGFNLVWLP